MRRVELGALIAFVAVECAAAATVLPEASPWWGWVGAPTVAWLVADALSGVVHFAADRGGSPDWPYIGRFLIFPFRDHHRDPLAMTQHDLVERSGLSALGASSLGVLVWLPGFPPSWGCLCVWMAFWVALTSEIHAWAHGSAAPLPVRWLQRAGILLSPARHQLHHNGSFDSHYCITSGFWDRLTDTWARKSPRGPTPDSQPAADLY